MAQLSKFGVPGGDSPILMPKLKYRFRVVFIGAGNGLLPGVNTFTSQIVSVGRPQLQHQTTELDVYNSKIYVAGKHSWSPISITVRDDINNEIASLIAAQMGRQMDHANQSGPLAGSNYKFGLLIQTLDGSQDETGVIDTWSINGCFINDYQTGDLDYSSSDAMTLTISITYDAADYHVGNIVIPNLPGQLGELGGGPALRTDSDLATNG
jgi:hypothetical protein